MSYFIIIIILTMQSPTHTDQFCQINPPDNQYSSQDQSEPDLLRTSQKNKPNNKIELTFNKLTFDSNFPAGNLRSINCLENGTYPELLEIQFMGNSDVQGDSRDKSWFYFAINGLENTDYTNICFKWLNANMYRKFVKEKKYKPYIFYREESEEGCREWGTSFVDTINILQDQRIQAEFSLLIASNTTKLQIAANLPYTLGDLQKLHQKMTESLYIRSKSVYYHRQLAIQSPDQLPVYLFTITSVNNVLSYGEHEMQIWPKKGIRPHKLKNRPEIIITGRVHPSEVSSSWFLEGIFENLVNNEEYSILLQLFIFRIFPMINPDGVENGNYRLDSYQQNLNRFYGHSNQQTSPSVFVVEKLIEKLRDHNKLLMYVDVHGHSSPKPSFIYGNYGTNLFQSMQNRTFCKLLQSYNSNEGTFEYISCQFSKRNMSVKEKYDEHSKQSSGRVFAYRGNSQQDNLQTNLRNFYFVEHSYTYEVMPYILANPRKNIRKNYSRIQNSNSYKNLNIKATLPLYKSQSLSAIEPTLQQIKTNYKSQGYYFLLSLSQLLGVNYRHQENRGIEEVYNYRRIVYRELSKIPEYFLSDRNKRILTKEIDHHFLQIYCQKWEILEVYEEFLNRNLEICKKSEKCALFLFNKTKPKIQKPLPVKSNIRNSYKSEKKEQSDRIPTEQKKTNEFQPFEKSQQGITSKLGHNLEYIKNIPAHKVRQIQFNDMLSTSQRKIHEKNNLKGVNFEEKNKLSKKKGSHYTETGEMQDRIRRIIFRHKTQNQLDYPTLDENTKLEKLEKFESDIDTDIRRHNYQDKKYTKKNLYQVFQPKMYPGEDFDDGNMIDKSINREKMSNHILDSNQFTFQMQDIMKRISTKRERGFDNIYHNEMINDRQKNRQYQLSTKKARPYKQKQTEEKKAMGSEPKQYTGIQSNTILPPVSTPSVPQDSHSVSHDRQFTYRSKLQGLKKIKSKKKIDNIFDRNSQQLQSIRNELRESLIYEQGQNSDPRTKIFAKWRHTEKVNSGVKLDEEKEKN